MIQMFIGIAISIFLIGATVFIYINQNKENSLYNKVTKLIENDNARQMINTLTVSTVVIINVLLISLVLSIFLPSVEWGWIDRNTLITTVATIIGGFFGFIGAAIGIIGTYGAFYLGINKEKQQRISTSYQIMYYMINNSIQKTYSVTRTIVSGYRRLKDNDENTVLTGNIEEDLKFLSGTDFSGDFDFFKSLEVLDTKMTKEQWVSYKGFKEDIENAFKKENLKELIYDDDWYKYIIDLPEAYVGEITDWINILKFKKVNKFFEFVEARNLMIMDVDWIYKSKYVRKQSSSNQASDVAHNYKCIYKQMLDDDERKKSNK